MYSRVCSSVSHNQTFVKHTEVKHETITMVKDGDAIRVLLLRERGRQPAMPQAWRKRNTHSLGRVYRAGDRAFFRCCTFRTNAGALMGKDIFVTIRFMLGQSPGKDALEKEGSSIQEYAEELINEMNLGDLSEHEIEIKAVEK